MVTVKFEPISEYGLEYIWKNIRIKDKEELALMGMNESNYRSLLDAEGLIAVADGVPVCIFWGMPMERVVQFCFFGTDILYRYRKTFHKLSKQIIFDANVYWFHYQPIIFVWEDYPEANTWVKSLGFKKSNHRFKLCDEWFNTYTG